MHADEKTVTVAVVVEHPLAGIRGTHYVEVKASLIHKELWAANREREAGYLVISSKIWPRI